MAKRKPATRSGGRRAPSASASRPAARRAAARPAGARAGGVTTRAAGAGRAKTGSGPVAPRANTAGGRAAPGRTGRGQPPDVVIDRDRAAGAPSRGPAKAPPRGPQAAPPSAAASRARRPPFEKAPGEEGPSPAVPSSLDLNLRPSAARSGRAELEERYREHHETDPGMTAGDIDADWESAYSVGDEAPGGDNPTPGQAVVEDVGRALGVEYEDGEELKAVDKIESRDRHRWELDPASAEDYRERTRGGGKKRKK